MVDATGMEAVISRWDASGLSLRRFGQKEGISYSKLVYWRQKLRGGKAGAKRTASIPAKPATDLVPVQVVPDEAPSNPSPAPFSVWLGNGVAVDVPTGFDERDLRRLVDLLTSC